MDNKHLSILFLFALFSLLFISCSPTIPPFDEPPENLAEVRNTISSINSGEEYLGNNEEAKKVLRALREKTPEAFEKFGLDLYVWLENHPEAAIDAFAYPTREGVKAEIKMEAKNDTYIFTSNSLTDIISGDPDGNTSWRRLKRIYGDNRFVNLGDSEYPFYGMKDFPAAKKINSLVYYIKEYDKFPFKIYYWGKNHPGILSRDDPEYYEYEYSYFGNWKFKADYYGYDIPNIPISPYNEFYIWLAADEVAVVNQLATPYEITLLEKVVPMILQAYYPIAFASENDREKAFRCLKKYGIEEEESKRIYDFLMLIE